MSNVSNVVRVSDLILCRTILGIFHKWMNLILSEDKQKIKLGVFMSPQIGLIYGLI